MEIEILSINATVFKNRTPISADAEGSFGRQKVGLRTSLAVSSKEYVSLCSRYIFIESEDVFNMLTDILYKITRTAFCLSPNHLSQLSYSSTPLPNIYIMCFWRKKWIVFSWPGLFCSNFVVVVVKRLKWPDDSSYILLMALDWSSVIVPPQSFVNNFTFLHLLENYQVHCYHFGMKHQSKLGIVK